MLSQWEGVAPSWWCHAHFQGVKLKLRSRAFCWCIVCFCTTYGSFRILKKAGEKIFLIFVILRNCGNNLISKKNSPAFFNIMKEPLLVQKQTIHQQKALDLSFLETESLRAWHYQEEATPSRRESIFCWILCPRFWFLTLCLLRHGQALMRMPRLCPLGSK